MPTSNNALKHGAFARMTVFPWEDQAEFDALHESFRAELKPSGITEELIVLDIADANWRKRRVRTGQVIAAYKYRLPPELLQAAKQGPEAVAEYARNEKPSSGGLLMTAAQTLDLVKKRITRDDIVQSAPTAPLPQTAVEQAYDPDVMLKVERLEASLEARVTKSFHRLAATKAFKKLHGLDCELVAVPEQIVQPEPERPRQWCEEVLNRAKRR